MNLRFRKQRDATKPDLYYQVFDGEHKVGIVWRTRYGLWQAFAGLLHGAVDGSGFDTRDQAGRFLAHVGAWTRKEKRDRARTST